MDDLERYLAGLPLNEENAALMEGRDPALRYPLDSAQPAGEWTANGEISADDRDWLRRLVREPGFSVFLRLLNSAVANREKGAIVLSSSDPLSNRDQITSEWAYVACFKAVMRDIQLMVQDVIEK